jgi:hypothetical protein
MMKRTFSVLLPVTVLLSACGGGGGTGNSASSTVTGTAAYGKPMAGALVVATDAQTGQQCGQATTFADGTFSLNTSDCHPGDALLFSVSGGTPNGSPLDAIALPANGQLVSGTVNITPLTTLDLMTALAMTNLTITSISGGPHSQPSLQAISNPNFPGTYRIAEQTINDDLNSVLSKYGINGAIFHSVTQIFVANGTGIDGFFDAYPLSASGPGFIELGNAGNYLLQLTFPTNSGQTYTLSGSATATQSGSGTSTSGSSSGSGSTSNQTDATSCFNPHFLQNGNTINLSYDSTDSQGNTSTLTEMHSISGPVNWNGQSAWLDQYTGNASTTDYLIDHNNQSGIYSINFNGNTTNYSPYYNFIDFSTKSGQSYTYTTSYTSNGISAPIAQTVTTLFNGMKVVQVPAGNFNVCEFTENYAYQNTALSGANYQIVEDIAVGSGVDVQSVTTSSQGTTTLKLVSGNINGTAISP